MTATLGRSAEVTIEDFEKALDFMAQAMSMMGEEAIAYVPLYERIDNKLEEMRRAGDTMARVRERAAAARSKATRPRKPSC